MNHVLDAIKMRRSVRSFDIKSIPRDVLLAIIEAGNEAPSAMNSQPWRFVVVEDQEWKKKLLRAAMPQAKKITEAVKDIDPDRYEAIKRRYAELPDPIYYSAPAIVFVIGNGMYAAHSCPLACENMMLAAYSLGVGSCWVGFGSMVLDDAEVKKLLELKEGDAIFGPIILGYPKINPPRPPKRDAKVKWV